MIVTSTTQIQYTQTTNKSKNNQEVQNPFKGQDYVLNTLDEEGNELLNDILTGKTDEEKWLIKLGLDMELSTEVKDGSLANKTGIDNSKENAMDMLDAYIQRRKELFTPDMIGVGATAERLLEAYKASENSFNVQNTEESVIDDFLEDLYSKNSSSLKSAIAKDEIENKVNEYAQLMMEENGDTPKSELDASKILNEYKRELLQEYKDTLESAKNEKITPQQEAIIKVLLDENKKETSSLEKLIATTDVNKLSDAKELDSKFKDNAIPTVEELLDEEGMAFLNKTLERMPEEDQNFAKLFLSFQLSIKSENVVNGKLHIEREIGKLDSKTIENKLDLLIAKGRDRKGEKTELINYVLKELKDFYSDKIQNNTSNKNQENPIQNNITDIDVYQLPTLDDKANTMLNNLLVGKSDSEKTNAKTESIQANSYMQNLDEKGNEIINKILEGRTETEKFAIKGILDRQLNFKHTEAYAMAVDAFNEYNKSDIGVPIQQNGFKNKEILLDNLDEFIERQSNGIDNLGILEIAKQLRNEYM